MSKSVLLLSFWNPTEKQPGNGLFIHDQMNAVAATLSNVTFLEINILHRNKTIFKTEIIVESLFQNKKIKLNIYSSFWKFIYVNPWFVFLVVNRILNKRFSEIKPEIIHSNVIYPCGIVGYFLSKKFKSQHFISEHWSKAAALSQRFLYRRAALNAYSKADGVFCVSNFLAQTISNVTQRADIKIIPNIIDTEIFKYSPKNIPENELHFACTASWKLPKRFDLILAGLVSFSKQTQKKIILHVIGTGVQLEQIQSATLPSNFEIIQHGFKTKPEIAEILRNSNFFLHASNIETFSIVTAEALCTGTPVLASNVGALPELINSGNGVLVNNSVEEWIEGLPKISSLKFDNEKIASVVNGMYSPERIANQIISNYK
jgi:L-malate glycosyltransferase